ncbi:CRE-SMA-4 protein [Caenorhabditis remanei]|uniref:CRE-SMA-4 protein n=1 Tax=Caenorhabditis remanei TaxID=31234 RepID=E3LYU5_CAERE|nr:CRE-SMA-4 protein [Caenorhabditis remanei]
MTSQPSTSNPMYYDQLYGAEQMIQYTPMDYQTNLLCGMQYFNNSHNRYQFPVPIPHMSSPYTVSHHPPNLHNMHTTNSLDESPPFNGFIGTMLIPPPQIAYNNNSIFTPPPPPAPSQPSQPPQPTPQQQAQQAASSQPPPSQSVSHQTSSHSQNAGAVLTTAMDSCQQISHVLQCYQQGGEDSEFVRKAIESLVKKLKDKRIELDALITAVTSNGKQPTGCVTIQRSLDGRLQVAGRKGVPHVVYARIWRWPKVSKNELVKLVQCQTCADHPDNICINPYHYERVVSNRITSADNTLHGGDIPMKNEYMGEQGMIDGSYGDWPSTPPDNNFNGGFPTSNVQHTSPQLPPLISDIPLDLTQIIVPTPSQPLDNWCSIIYYELDTQIGETFKVSALDHGKVIVDGGMDPHGENEGRFCLGALSNVHRTDASEKARIHIGGGVELTAHANGNVSITSNCKIFVRSGYLDYTQGAEYSSKAHRFTPNEATFTVVFDIRWAYMQMLRRSESSNEAVRAQAAAVAGYAPMSVMPAIMPDSGVDRMRRDFCTIAISFVKAWGDIYQRKTIKETPCWIEVTLHRPLQLLDQLLKNSSQFGSS